MFLALWVAINTCKLCTFQYAASALTHPSVHSHVNHVTHVYIHFFLKYDILNKIIIIKTSKCSTIVSVEHLWTISQMEMIFSLLTFYVGIFLKWKNPDGNFNFNKERNRNKYILTIHKSTLYAYRNISPYYGGNLV